AAHIVGVGGVELAGHLGFFIGNMDEVGCRQYGDGRDKHRPRADPEGDAQGDKDKAEIHRIPGKTVGTFGDQLAVGRRRWVDLGAFPAEQKDRPRGHDDPNDDKKNAQRRKPQTRNLSPAKQPGHGSGKQNKDQGPDRRRKFHHSTPPKRAVGAGDAAPTIAASPRVSDRPTAMRSGTLLSVGRCYTPAKSAERGFFSAYFFTATYGVCSLPETNSGGYRITCLPACLNCSMPLPSM